ncbi:hypothetical protein H3H37_01420 [Duganella sp. LX20W]|uniref:Transmembrane protein n=1 Tax=Rugamonas brunnea TaxID=2758569 RepID=A0A7W2IAA9_9BURK|nr:hypothetical protein [Rugamonas brunnea]MBA5635712.1 hypothetical protein [Rugamonas brunnea]
MIGMATKLAALQLLRQRLLAAADPQLAALGNLLSTQARYASFGALGTAIGDFAPVRLPASGTLGAAGANPYIALWKLVFNVFGGDGTAANPGLKPVLDRIRDLLDRLDAVAAAEDLDALQAMSGEVDTLNQIATDLSAILVAIKGDGTLTNLGIVPQVADLIGTRMMPASVRPRAGGGAGFPPRFWTLREFLSQRRTGRFAKRLWDTAQSSGRDEFKAYALGWLSSWSLSAGGASAVASIVGAPYRNQWWRSRFVGNYIDLWSYGYAKVGPRPKPYTDWPNLCAQKLHEQIAVPGAAFDPDHMMQDLRLGNALGTGLPADFVSYWLDAYEHVYGDLGMDRPQMDADRLQDAYAMAWLVLWFQTSPQTLGCNAVAPVAPTDCGGAPPWTNPVVPGDAGGSTGGPPPPEIDKKIKPANVVCAILLAILGIVALCFGGWVAGGAAIAGAIALAASAGTIDWDKFRCSLVWYRIYMYNGLRALHDVMSLGGLVHPYTPELSTDDTVVQLLSAIPTHIRTGDNIVLTRPSREGYPVVPWNGMGFSWFDDASGALEQPGTQPALAAAYPSGFLDDPANPLGSRSPFDASPWPFAPGMGNQPAGFINTVDAMLAWLGAPTSELPDHDLDGDRGLGFQNWHFVTDDWTNPVDIEPST